MRASRSPFSFGKLACQQRREARETETLASRLVAAVACAAAVVVVVVVVVVDQPGRLYDATLSARSRRPSEPPSPQEVDEKAS